MTTSLHIEEILKDIPAKWLDILWNGRELRLAPGNLSMHGHSFLLGGAPAPFAMEAVAALFFSMNWSSSCASLQNLIIQRRAWAEKFTEVPMIAFMTELARQGRLTIYAGTNTYNAMSWHARKRTQALISSFGFRLGLYFAWQPGDDPQVPGKPYIPVILKEADFRAKVLEFADYSPADDSPLYLPCETCLVS